MDVYSGSYDTTVSVHSLISGSHSATWEYGIRVHCLRQDVTEAEQGVSIWSHLYQDCILLIRIPSINPVCVG